MLTHPNTVVIVLPDSLVKLLAWVTGEYTNKLYFNDQNKIKQILEMLTYLLNKTYDEDMTKCLLHSFRLYE